jgi:hypothetical protein
LKVSRMMKILDQQANGTEESKRQTEEYNEQMPREGVVQSKYVNTC